MLLPQEIIADLCRLRSTKLKCAMCESRQFFQRGGGGGNYDNFFFAFFVHEGRRGERIQYHYAGLTLNAGFAAL